MFVCSEISIINVIVKHMQHVGIIRAFCLSFFGGRTYQVTALAGVQQEQFTLHKIVKHVYHKFQKNSGVSHESNFIQIIKGSSLPWF